MTDFLTAIRLYLLAQKSITDLCSTDKDGNACQPRVYVMAIPEEIIEQMPLKTVVAVASGGALNAHRVTGQPIIDVVCYGETDFEAAKMERVAAQALKDLHREVFSGVLLHSASVASGPLQARDPETFWPAMRRQAIIRHDEREVS